MNEKKPLIQKIETFYSDIVEEYKEITLAIRNDATPLAIFRKKDYDAHIGKLRGLKKKLAALAADPKESAGNKQLTDLGHEFNKALAMFGNLCDLQIQVQTSLKNTASRKGGKFSECSEYVRKLNNYNKEVQAELHELDVRYADLMDETEVN